MEISTRQKVIDASAAGTRLGTSLRSVLKELKQLDAEESPISERLTPEIARMTHQVYETMLDSPVGTVEELSAGNAVFTTEEIDEFQNRFSSINTWNKEPPSSLREIRILANAMLGWIHGTMTSRSALFAAAQSANHSCSSPGAPVENAADTPAPPPGQYL